MIASPRYLEWFSYESLPLSTAPRMADNFNGPGHRQGYYTTRRGRPHRKLAPNFKNFEGAGDPSKIHGREDLAPHNTNHSESQINLSQQWDAFPHCNYTILTSEPCDTGHEGGQLSANDNGGFTLHKGPLLDPDSRSEVGSVTLREVTPHEHPALPTINEFTHIPGATRYEGFRRGRPYGQTRPTVRKVSCPRSCLTPIQNYHGTAIPPNLITPYDYSIPPVSIHHPLILPPLITQGRIHMTINTFICRNMTYFTHQPWPLIPIPPGSPLICTAHNSNSCLQQAVYHLI